MKVLVTGATGFIGDHVINFLLTQNVSIIATSQDEEKAKKKNWYNRVTYLPYSIGKENTGNLMDYFGRPDLCIHLAWDGLTNFKDQEHVDSFTGKHLSFLSNLIENGIRKVTVTGTCLEYGKIEGELSEDLTPNPILPYAIGKNNLKEALEHLQKKKRFELDWIRLFYMYGEGQSPKSLLAQLEKHLIEQESIFNMSEGEQVRDYLPVEKVAELIVNLALLENGSGVINCSSGKPIKIKTLVENYLELKNAQIELNVGYYPYPDYEAFKFWGSVKKRNKLLNR